MSSNTGKPRFLSWFIFLIIMSAALFGFHKIRNMEGKPQGEEAPPPAKVVFMQPIKTEITNIFEEIGQTEAILEANITARIEGTLLARQFIEGTDVKKDDVLFLIEKDKFEAELDKAMANFNNARALLTEVTNHLERLEKTMKEGVSKADMDAAISAKAKAEAQLENTKAAIRIAKLNLDYTTITAPISGKIGKVNISEGNIVSANSGTLATIVQLNPIYAVFAIGEDKALSMNKSGRSRDFSDIEVSLVLSNGMEFPHKGKLVFMDNRISQEAGTVLMRATFPNPDELLLPGQFVNIKLEPQEKVPAFLIPEAAIMRDQSGAYIFIIENDTAIRRTVTLGRKIGLYRVAETGINGDEKIIYQGLERVRETAPVNPELKNIEETAKEEAK